MEGLEWFFRARWCWSKSEGLSCALVVLYRFARVVFMRLRPIPRYFCTAVPTVSAAKERSISHSFESCSAMSNISIDSSGIWSAWFADIKIEISVNCFWRSLIIPLPLCQTFFVTTRCVSFAPSGRDHFFDLAKVTDAKPPSWRRKVRAPAYAPASSR